MLHIGLSISCIAFLFVYVSVLVSSVRTTEATVVDSSSSSSSCSVVDSGDHPLALRESIRSGNWACAKKIVQQLTTPASSSLSSVFESEQRTIIDELNKLKLVITSSSASSTSISKIAPAFQWAQSTTELFLNVKFSHKIDAPATLNVEPLNVTLDEKSLYLHASDGTKHFGLDLNLFGNIVANESSWSLASVGRMTFQLKKEKTPSRWPKLLSKSSNSKKLKMHMWIEMQDKYAKELDKLEDEEGEEKVKKPTKDKAKTSDLPSNKDNVTIENPDTAVETASSDLAVGSDSDNANSSDINSNSNNNNADSAVNTTIIDETKGKDDVNSNTTKDDNPELKAKVQELEDERKRRRKEVDARSRIEKEHIEKEIADRKKQLIDNWINNTGDADGSSTANIVPEVSNSALDTSEIDNSVFSSVVVE